MLYYFDDFCKKHGLDENSAYARWSYKCYLEGVDDTINLFGQKFDSHLDQEGCCDDCPVMFNTIEDIKDDLEHKNEEEDAFKAILSAPIPPISRPAYIDELNAQYERDKKEQGSERDKGDTK